MKQLLPTVLALVLISAAVHGHKTTVTCKNFNISVAAGGRAPPQKETSKNTNSHSAKQRTPYSVSKCQQEIRAVPEGTAQTCGRITAPANGRVWHRRHQNHTSYWAIFTCNTGFVLIGHNVSICQAGAWIPNHIPVCSPVLSQTCSDNGLIQDQGLPIKKKVLGLGDTTKLNCEINGVWLKDGYRLTSSDLPPGHSFLPDGSLIVNYTDTGLLQENLYLCLSYNSTIIRLISAVAIHLQPCPEEDLSVEERNSVNLMCIDNNVVGFWSLLYGHLSEQHQGSSSGNLNIRHVSSDDQGVYVCRVSNRCKRVKLSVRTVQTTCGVPHYLVRRKRIIDGVKAPEGSLPWMGMISSEKNPVVCGCTLISDRWVLTAAHCLTSTRDDDGITDVLSLDQLKEKVHIKLGKHLRRQHEPGQIVSQISEVIAHPDFSPRSQDSHFQTVNKNDIALLKLATPVAFSATVSPICLPYPGFLATVSPGTLGLVTGWGRVSVRQSVTAYTLQEARLPIVDREICAKASDPYQITDRMLCAGYAESYRPDTCDGDSGGPYSIQGADGRWRLVGIVSWGQGCSSPGKFGIYTNVEKYFDWIMQAIRS